MATAEQSEFVLQFFIEEFLLRIDDDLRRRIEEHPTGIDVLLKEFLFIEENYLVFNRVANMDECVPLFEKWLLEYLLQSEADPDDLRKTNPVKLARIYEEMALKQPSEIDGAESDDDEMAVALAEQPMDVAIEKVCLKPDYEEDDEDEKKEKDEEDEQRIPPALKRKVLLRWSIWEDYKHAMLDFDEKRGHYDGCNLEDFSNEELAQRALDFKFSKAREWDHAVMVTRNYRYD